jgi:hypothetical protein
LTLGLTNMLKKRLRPGIWIALALTLLLLLHVPAVVQAVCDPSLQSCSSNWGVGETFWGQGGQLNACSTGYCTKQSAGETAGGNTKLIEDQVMLDSPMAYYKLDEPNITSTLKDSSGNSRDGSWIAGSNGYPTFGNASLLTSDPTGNSPDWNGNSSGYANVPYGSWMDTSTGTLEGWWKSNTNCCNQYRFFGRYTSGANAWMYMDLDALNGHARVYARISGTVRQVAASSPTLWGGGTHHIVGTYDGTDLKLYIDGLERATGNWPGTLNTSPLDFQIGRRNDGASSKPDGRLDNIAVYDHALSAARVLDHYNAALLPPPSGSEYHAGSNTAISYPQAVLDDTPLSYWRFGDTSGTTAIDFSTNGRNGAYQNSPTLGAAGLLRADTDTAVRFDGTDDYASLASAAWMNVPAFSTEAWVKTTASGQAIVSRDNSSSSKAWRLSVSSGFASFILHNGGSNYTLTGVTAINDGRTHHIVATYASGTMSIYVDGVLDGTLNGTAHSVTGTPALRVGTERLAGYFDGVIDEVAFYGSALTANQVARHYYAGTSGYQANSGFNSDRIESLEFQVNTGSVDLGTVTTSNTGTGTATFSVKSYLANGYQVVTASPPPKYGTYTLSGMPSQAASSPGTEQFGINLKANTSPTTFGAEPAQVPDATFSYGDAAPGYNRPDVYKYVNGDVIASSLKSSGETDYTISYIMNIGNLTPGGTYNMAHVLVAPSTF